MSVWSIRRASEQGGRTEITSASLVELVLFGAMFGIPIVLLISGSLALGSPKIVAAAILGLLGTGVTLFLLAKVSVLRRGQLISFGSGKMSPAMRWCYRLGYVLCGLGIAFALGTLRWWAAA